MPASASAFDAYFLSMLPSKDDGLATGRGVVATAESPTGVTQSNNTNATKKSVNVAQKHSEICTSGDGVRTQTWRACQRCRRLKLKCDHERPCAACVRRGYDLASRARFAMPGSDLDVCRCDQVRWDVCGLGPNKSAGKEDRNASP